MDSVNQPRNDVRAFIHKRLLSGAFGLVTGGPLAAAGGFLRPRGGASPISASTGRRVTSNMLLRRSRCPGGEIWNRTNVRDQGGRCVRDASFSVGPVTVDPRAFPPGGAPLFSFSSARGAGPGAAVMGRYGAALEPDVVMSSRSVCIPGMVIGDDGLCYNRSQIKNADRRWPRGRRPLLTGGDMAAISKASRAAGRLERTTKRLQKMGMLKKPNRPRPQQKLLPLPAHHN